MSLLDTVEPDWYGNANSLSEKHTALVAKWKGNGTLGLYSRETVESLLAECRKEARKEALLEAEAAHDHEDVLAPVGNSAYGEAYQDGWIAGAAAYREELRRMAESDKTTMEGEKHE